MPEKQQQRWYEQQVGDGSVILQVAVVETGSASEMTYIVSSGALNSTHSLTVETGVWIVVLQNAEYGSVA